MYKKTAYYGVLSALAILLSYVESLVPAPIPVPGVKLGLANCIILFALYQEGFTGAITIALVRVVVSGLLFSGMAGILYSMAGVVASIPVMMLCRKLGLSVPTVSILGGVFHNLGQLVLACFVVNNIHLLLYLPPLFVFGAAAGFLTGIAAKRCMYVWRGGRTDAI